MKRALLRVVGKSILAVGNLFWNRGTEWTFKVHQKLGRIAIKMNHKHKLDLWDDGDEE